MLNRFQFNHSSIQLDQGGLNNAIIPVSNFSVDDDIVFNNFGLQNSIYITSDVDISAPSRELNFAKLPSMDGEVYNSDYLRRKIITLTGRIFKSTQSALETEIDNFKKAMIKANGNLDISLVTGGTKRRYIATLQNPNSIFAQRKGSDISSAPYVLQFLAHEGLAEDKTFTNQAFTVNALVFNTALYNTGTYKTPLWLYLINTTVSGITGIKVENLTTGETIEITETVSSGDVVQFDGRDKSVELNSTEVDFDGYFPSLAVGENLMQITYTGTSVTTVSATAKTKNRYL